MDEIAGIGLFIRGATAIFAILKRPRGAVYRFNGMKCNFGAKVSRLPS
jgi:hypothetical protein